MKHHPSIDPALLARCRQLRINATDAEALLWKLLRSRQLGSVKFRRQHPAEGFILDFYCPEARLGIELDGGGHAKPGQAGDDAHRTDVLAQTGIRVLRFWNTEVMEDPEAVLAVIWEAVKAGVPG
jgi:very-short-patch-repair endonuclease